jgi:lysophospholipase L1-like esterase
MNLGQHYSLLIINYSLFTPEGKVFPRICKFTVMPIRFLRCMAFLALLLAFLWGHGTNVTFRVDVATLSMVDTSGIHIVGSINNWDPGATALDSIGLGRYEITLSLVAGSVATFKYVNGNAWGQEEGVVGECGFNTYRYLYVPATDTVLPWVCFGYCDSACTPATGRRVACVGNSIAWGWDLPDKIHQSYPSLLQDSLGPSFLVENFGAPGTAVIRHAGNPYHRSEQFRHLIPFAPQEALIALGINDSKQPIWANYAPDFVQDYDSLYMALDTLAGMERIWICLPTTNFEPLFGIDSAVVAQQIVPLICGIARDRMLDIIDLHGFTSGLGSYFLDGLHPDTTATHMIATEIYRILQLPRPQVTLSGSLPTVATGYAWQWYLDGDTVPASWGGRAQTLSVAPTGTYRVGVQIDSVLKHVLLSDTLFVNGVAVGQQTVVQCNLFPNPAQNSLRDPGVSGAGGCCEDIFAAREIGA